MENDAMYRRLEEVDPDVASAIDNEVRRQHEGLELIASENFVSEAVLEAMGSVFTNKYAEGYPGKRYYGGCEYADVVEELARERAKKLFGAEHANVAATRWFPSQHGSVRSRAATGRHNPGAEPCAWRASHAWTSLEFLGQDLSHRSLRSDERVGDD